ncbi:MAG: hypothetical protein ACK8QZ_08365 [Anaerolineales bacterium]
MTEEEEEKKEEKYMASEWLVFFGAISILGGGCWLLMRNNKPLQPQTVEEAHYKLGREHALAGKKASLTTEAYQDGFADGQKSLQENS